MHTETNITCLRVRVLINNNCFLVWAVFPRPVATVPPEAVGTVNSGAPQQAGSSPLLAPRVHRLSGKCAVNTSECSCYKKHCLQLHSVSDSGFT